MIRPPITRESILAFLETVIREADHPMTDDATITVNGDGSVLLEPCDGSAWTVLIHEVRSGKPWDDNDDLDSQ